MISQDEVKKLVRDYYTEAVKARKSSAPTGSPPSGCCSGSPSAGDLVQIAGYGSEELATLPGDAVASSMGCGNPVSFAGIERGHVVVDIGSGAGIDCLIAAEKVGPEGRIIGLDMTPAMIERATANARKAGKQNVEFRLGEADSMPIENGSVDWVISNCVINLAPDKRRVFQEAFRVLRPGGRISVSDIVADIPRLFRIRSLYASCLTGALPEEKYLQAVADAGFQDVRVIARHTYDIEQLAVLFGEKRLVGRILRWAAKPWLRPLAQRVLQRVASVQVTAIKPLAASRAA